MCCCRPINHFNWGQQLICLGLQWQTYCWYINIRPKEGHGWYAEITCRCWLFFPRSRAQHHLLRPTISSSGLCALWDSWLTTTRLVLPDWYLAALGSWLLCVVIDQWEFSHQYCICSCGKSSGLTWHQATLLSVIAVMLTWWSTINSCSAASLTDPLLEFIMQYGHCIAISIKPLAKNWKFTNLFA